MSYDGAIKALSSDALKFVKDDYVIGLGSGRAATALVKSLAKLIKLKGYNIRGVPTSLQIKLTAEEGGIHLVEADQVDHIDVVFDGADQIDSQKYVIKGGGGALTREKIVASASRKFVCIVDESKLSDVLGSFPLPVEVIPMAQSLVSRKLIGMGGLPELRPDLTTDNGNVILDVRNLDLTDPMTVEIALNAIAGVVDNGIFARQRADVLLVGRGSGVDQITV